MKKLFLLGAIASAAISAPAYATAFGIASISIQHYSATNTPEWLQVAEFEAFNTLGVNVAATSNGGTATRSSQYAGTGYLVQSGAGNALNGTIGGSYFSGTSSQWIYHSGSTALSEYLKVSFASVQNLNSINIYGRTDCCAARDIYKITLYNASNAVVASYNNLSANNAAHLASFAFTTNVGVAPVPEPATWASMLLGMGLSGTMLRRRKTGRFHAVPAG